MNRRVCIIAAGIIAIALVVAGTLSLEHQRRESNERALRTERIVRMLRQ
jgi:hypothetical protein